MPVSITQEQKETISKSVPQKGGYRSLFYALFEGGATDELPPVRLTVRQQETIKRVEAINLQEANRLRRQFEQATTDVSLSGPILGAFAAVTELAGFVKERICTFQIPLLRRAGDERKTHGRD